jgi:hypothetical protein
MDEFRRALGAARTLTIAYGKILQTPRDRLRPLSALPVDKETMKLALKTDAEFQASQGELDKPLTLEGIGKMTLRDAYISTYAQLADFVPDDLAARVNPYWRFMATEGQRIKAGEQVDRMTQARELTKRAPSEADQQAIERAEDEFRVLVDEMTAYLDRIAPRRDNAGRSEKG